MHGLRSNLCVVQVVRSTGTSASKILHKDLEDCIADQPRVNTWWYTPVVHVCVKSCMCAQTCPGMVYILVIRKQSFLFFRVLRFVECRIQIEN